MKSLSFCKFHGFGNDYIVFEAAEVDVSLSTVAKAICNRNTGVGADGIAVIGTFDTSPRFSCRIFNPDGSEAGFSGNGTRCAVAYLNYQGLCNDEHIPLSTPSGVKRFEFLRREQNSFFYRAELGSPSFQLPATPPFEEFRDRPMPEQVILCLPDEHTFIKFLYVDVGNPVACFFTDEGISEFSEFDWRHIGAEVESFTEAFPARTNVVFIKVIDDENIEIRIWERGAGETASSGTCSIAAAVAAAAVGGTERELFVHAPGGTTEAIWREADGEMLITGSAELVHCGEWYYEI